MIRSRKWSDHYTESRETIWVSDERQSSPRASDGSRVYCFSTCGDLIIVVPPSGGCFTIMSLDEALSFIELLERSCPADTLVIVMHSNGDFVFADDEVQLDALGSTLRQCAGIRALRQDHVLH